MDQQTPLQDLVVSLYIFPFEYQLDRTDVTDIWQGIMPETATKVKSEVVSICHTIDPRRSSSHFRSDNPLGYPMEVEMEMAGGTDQAKGLNLFHDMRFMVFKVKNRAAINYFKQTDQALDDGKFNTSFFLGGSEIGYETGRYLSLIHI